MDILKITTTLLLVSLSNVQASPIYATYLSISGKLELSQVEVGSTLYSANLNHILGTNPMRFIVDMASVQTLSEVTEDGVERPSLSANRLTIPRVAVGNGLYHVEMQVVESAPLTFQLSTVDQKSCFSVSPLDEPAMNNIDPLGGTNPPGHTFPTVHTYMMLVNPSSPSPVYSPGEITITSIASSENLTMGSSDFSIRFSACGQTEITGYFYHVTSLDSQLSSLLEAPANCQEYSDGNHDFRYCDYQTNIEISSGSLLGYAGGPLSGSAALDFGLRDTLSPPINYANPSRFVANDHMFYVVCPYDYYQLGPERDMLLNKLQESRTDSPICGTVALDNQGSMQGLWYEASYTNEETQQANEADHIALVPSNTEPQTTGVLSIGNTQLNSDGYYFDYLETG